MELSRILRFSDWNPQLFREIKGRLKGRNIAIAVGLSLVAQVLLIGSCLRLLPVAPPLGQYTHLIRSNYCTGTANYPYYDYNYSCLRDPVGNFLINWPNWWLTVFYWLSLIGIFAVLVVGTYMLISDQEREERRGTLNFIRLSPQSTQAILLGKLLGVPILLYVAGIVAIPLHLWAGIAGQIPVGLIVSFYGVLAASCACFYSAALLFGLVSSWLGGFQAWLGSGTLFFFLGLATLKPIQYSAADWLNVLSPTLTLFSACLTIVDENFFDLASYYFNELQWFYLPVSDRVLGIVLLTLASYGFWTYWIFQALLRRFPNPSATMLSKRQSYLLVAGAEVLLLGFALQESGNIGDSFGSLFALNLLLFLGLIAALTPHRQALYDWARYRRDNVPTRRRFWHPSVVQDLIWSEKSPPLVAIAINLVSTTVILLPWSLRWEHALPTLILTLNFILIYAAIAQLMLFMKTQKPTIWAVSTLSITALLPPIILSVLFGASQKTPPELWTFSVFPAFWSWESITQISDRSLVLVFLGQWTILGVLSLQLTRQLRRAGESASKALLAGRN